MFSIDLILPAALWSWKSTQPLTDMRTRNIPGGKGRPVLEGLQTHRHLWADYLKNVGTLTSQNFMGLQGLIQGWLFET
jgi:hypothetical protein